MSSFVIPSPPAVTLPVRGSASTFPVRRVYCVGRNYAAHAVEMGHDPSREAPFFFQKNPDNLVAHGKPFPYPVQSRNVHHEVECFVALKNGGADISVGEALECVYGYGVAVDFTRRDIQDEAKAKSRPWEMAKAFEGSAPVSAIAPAAEIGHPARGAISLVRNGTVVQNGDLSQMIWKTAEIIAELSRYVRLAAGDVILTGTPAGVGPVERGDRIACTIEGVGELAFEVI
ncbi:fumarylacetoacetate hydrolase family protein [Martelella mediterranea]|uniref:fumarylacetoacetate hydrolase family protein n=1 Tax=Martelella mediterranea TaxID=293089 RepID=UPI001E40B9B0|nr:fumarylacetoacetate hydrolase family protein [Martelella mediterranea]MCD1632434.1 fumarylacetoacetate hydrolase family protein [Martelella mediterranea]